MGKKDLKSQMIDLIESHISTLGYRVVELDLIKNRERKLRLYIEWKDLSKPIGVEDCAKVSRAIDEPLDVNSDLDEFFKGSYELEVSSPGIQRPLRTLEDFERFSGRNAKICLYRAMKSEEIENTEYLEKNPKQKNFRGILNGIRDSKVMISPAETKAIGSVSIPLELISQAHLDPEIDFEKGYLS